MKKLTAEQVKSLLVKAANKHNAELKARHAMGHWYGRSERKYTNVAGQYKVRSNIFTNHSGAYYFCPEQMYATSYSWWGMLVVVNGKIIRNECNYSQATAYHQDKLDLALKALKIKPDIIVNTRANIRDMKEVAAHYEMEQAELLVKLENCQKKSLPFYKAQLKKVEKLMKQMEDAKIGVRFTKKAAVKALDNARTRRVQKLSCKRERKVREIGFRTADGTEVETVSFNRPSLTLVVNND